MPKTVILPPDVQVVLDSLTAVAPSNGGDTLNWLDCHSDEILLCWASMECTQLALALGQMPASLDTWRRSRNHLLPRPGDCQAGVSTETNEVTTMESEALERLKLDPKRDDQRAFKWLDAHRDDVATVLLAHGKAFLANRCSLPYSAVDMWQRSRGLLYTHHIHRGLRAATQVSAETSPSRRVPKHTKLPQGEYTIEYWRGQAEALLKVVALLSNGRNP